MSEANIRNLTVGYSWTSPKWKKPEQMPKLILQGGWFEDAGFEIGNPVRVAVEPNIIKVYNVATLYTLPTGDDEESYVLDEFIKFNDELHYEGYAERLRKFYPHQFEELLRQFKTDYGFYFRK